MYEVFLKGGPVMWPLLACSVLSLTVILERILSGWLRGRRSRPELIEKMLALTATGDLDSAANLGRNSGDPKAKVLAVGLNYGGQGSGEAMRLASQDDIEYMKRGLNVLDTIITLAPLLGILGTVLGIIESFDLLGASGIAEPQAVIGGIAQALITTAAGLTIAVLTLVPFNFFVARVQRHAQELEQLTAAFLLAYRKSGEIGDADQDRL
ncbi:MAG: MotA/TolQ/ExbB proton channel family protein [SAR324 cluster bacterium]|nr:MotA/TolQ/ExbB proton channel family protein [SAR324 cluster bacterium]